MCDVCVMNAVKDKMLSRRNFFKASAAGAAAVTAGGLGTGSAALAAGHGFIADMTHELSEEFPTYFGTPGLSRKALNTFEEHSFNLLEFTIMEHCGTHIDAPLHFSADGASVAELQVSDLVAPLCCIDIRARAAENPDTEVTPDDLKDWMSKHGDIPAHACVAMNSGWSSKAATDAFRNADDDGVMHFPGFHIEATTMLMEETGATSMAVDTLSLDHGPSSTFATHYGWLPTGRFGIECLANLDAMPASGGTIVIGAPKMKGGTGGPARIFGLA